jgi:hypothetical protein
MKKSIEANSLAPLHDLHKFQALLEKLDAETA